MAEREYATEVRRFIRAPSARVWALVADTNRFDRAAGLTPGEYSFELLREGDPSSRAAVATTRQYGITVRWVEPPYEWIEGRSVRGQRKFLSGPMSRGAFRVTLTPEGDGTVVEGRTNFFGSGVMSALLGFYIRGRLRRAFARYLDSIEKVLAQTDTAAEVDPSEPPATRARRALMATAPDGVTSGNVSPINEADFAYRSAKLANAPVDPEIRQRLIDHLRARPDDELAQMRPFELARAWGVDRRETLRTFLLAARAGMVELVWQLNCPTCRVASDVADSLATVGRESHCDACNVAFDVDFAEHVEAVFKVSPALRPVETAVYCASSPWFRPHVFAQVYVEPGETREFAATLPTGSLLLRTLTGKRRATIDLEGHAPATLEARIGESELHVSTDGSSDIGSDSTVRLHNETGEAVVVLIERRGWSADIVFGSTITTLPDFVDLFSAEAPASGVELTVGALTVLFSDLTGSTAMYERIGDARAFAIVQEHFRLMAEAITSNRGAIVKTMGDAVMANFTSPADAMRAAIQMVEKTDGVHGSIGLSVKIGLHEGPCLCVRANERLDYFGTTVNVAARLQAQAHPSEIVVMQSLLEHPEIGTLARERAFPARRFEAHLKGIREEQRLVGLDAGAERAAVGKTG